MDVWDFDDADEDERIDNFILPLSSPLNIFNKSNSLTHQGQQGIGNLTLSYGNLTTDPTPYDSMDSPLPSTSTLTYQGM